MYPSYTNHTTSYLCISCLDQYDYSFLKCVVFQVRAQAAAGKGDWSTTITAVTVEGGTFLQSIFFRTLDYKLIEDLQNCGSRDPLNITIIFNE